VEHRLAKKALLAPAAPAAAAAPPSVTFWTTGDPTAGQRALNILWDAQAVLEPGPFDAGNPA